MEASAGDKPEIAGAETEEKQASTNKVPQSASSQPTANVPPQNTPTFAPELAAAVSMARPNDSTAVMAMETETPPTADSGVKRKQADESTTGTGPDASISEVPTKKPKVEASEPKTLTITKVIVDDAKDIVIEKALEATTPPKANTTNDEVKKMDPSREQAKEDSAPKRRSSRRLSDDGASNVESKNAKSSNEVVPEAKNEEAALSGDVVEHYITLVPLTSRPKPLKPLSNSELVELEKIFGIGKDGTQWDDDWMGVVALTEEEIPNPDAKSGEKTKPKTLMNWAIKGKRSMKLLNNLVRQIYNHKKTPKQAKKILGNADTNSYESLRDSIFRLSLDPLVLRQDGWTTTKAPAPEGASGGAFRIGEKVIWQGYTGVVIAFLHDTHIGDLWKAMWTEDYSTFDLELEELEHGSKKYERKEQKKAQSKEKGKDAASDARKSNRHLSNADFQVAGIEHGIVLATSYTRGARHGVFWPARVMHATEAKVTQSKRQKGTKVDVVFLAPYWNSDPLAAVKKRAQSFSDSIAAHGDALFSSGPIFEFESIDAHEESIQQYPYSASTGLDIDELRSSFKFAGLPKAVFARFLDSHRLALSLKTYSQNEMKSKAASDIDRTSAGLLEGHPLSALTANFPHEVLHLPFEFILSQLPHPEENDVNSNEEPPLRLGKILESMKPPASWGLGDNSKSSATADSPRYALTNGTPVSFEPMANGNKDDPYDVNRFLTGLPALQSLLSSNSTASTLIKNNLSGLMRAAPSSGIQELQDSQKKKRIASSVYQTWVIVKNQGEEMVASSRQADTMKEWRRCCERIYKYLCATVNFEGREKGESLVITDSRCNLHLTSSECYERPVRLPAALKAVRQAKGNIHIVNAVDDKYMELAEKKIILKAHKKSYIQRFKKRCFATTQGAIVPLTEDSEGNGGEDTKGTRGSWKAAVAAVGAALQGADMIMAGECVNAFCPTRPPGHHAGRELHAMKAVSNGFCVLNAVACAALYATTPISEGGLGLSRVCVIDIDVHHGNGTQDVLCSTYDPRFLYVSIHAGGPHVNGIDLGEIGEQMGHHLGRNPKKGIFPGRCGDTSPHEGVLNIPLGARVTSHALGTALITKVSPAVENFAPDLIIVSAGFDAHKNDPLNLGGLNAEDFGTLTEIICKLAFKSCSGRVLSVLEGGYGVPCCRPQHFPPPPTNVPKQDESEARENKETEQGKPQEAATVTANTASSHDAREGANKLPAARNVEVNDLPEARNVEAGEEVNDRPAARNVETNAIQDAGEEVNDPPAAQNVENVIKGAGEEVNNAPAAQNVAPNATMTSEQSKPAAVPATSPQEQIVPLQCLELGDDLPEGMPDVISNYALQKRLDKCHAEGFVHCVQEHVSALARCNVPTNI